MTISNDEFVPNVSMGYYYMGTALEEISKNAGKLYDPGVAEVCIRLFYEKEFKLEE